MYFIIYSYHIVRLLARMLFGLALSEIKADKLLKNIEDILKLNYIPKSVFYDKKKNNTFVK